MEASTLLQLCAGLALIAALYGSVGQAGASGFLAVMGLAGLAPAMIKPTALVLNLLVSSVVAYRFARAGHFSWSLLRPFLLLSVPAAFLGGWWVLPAEVFNRLLGVLLLVAGLPFFRGMAPAHGPVVPPSAPVAMVSGGVIGLLSGLTGMGGGVLLAPLLLVRGWAQVRTAAAISAVFIFVNSLMALLGLLSASPQLPIELPWLALAAVAGGAIGAQLGSHWLPQAVVVRILGITLVIAGLRLLC
ncbi:MAG: sulfite exporter TauE/SafE family protein [Cyanobium sp. PLM2.Bin73]|nr:MAG: sulfite exporter TauE/SafE family protein [Cyanobium sp. PLM2.Bin73]